MMSSRASLLALMMVAAGAAACSETKPPESPETTASTAEADSKPPPDKGDKGAPPPAETAGDPGKKPPNGPSVPAGLSMDAYEMTPSDCNELGRKYGEVARSDQMSQLSPKISEKQRQATAEQVEKVVGKLEETWTNGCHSTLVNKAVDHDALKCAYASKSVHDFDVCLNGQAGTPQAPSKPGKKNK